MSDPLHPLPAEPFVTVIVPSFNQGAYLDDTIQSVLQQDYPHLELWVVDGGSTDGTLGVLRRYDPDPRVHWLSEPDRGYADAVNKGLHRARGDLIGIQSSDDFYGRGAISQAVGFFAEHPDLVMVSGTFHRVTESGVPCAAHGAARREQWLTVDECALSANYPCQSACLFRADLARQVGGCDLEVDWVADHDIVLRVMAAGAARGGRSLKLDRYWAYVRQHPGQRNQERLKFKLALVLAAGKYDLSLGDLFTPQQRRRMLWQAHRAEYQFRTRRLGQGLRAWPAFARMLQHADVLGSRWRQVAEWPWLLPFGVGRRVIEALRWRLKARSSTEQPAPLPSRSRWFAESMSQGASRAPDERQLVGTRPGKAGEPGARKTTGS